MWTFDSETDPGYWVTVESPTNASLRDLTGTANGPVAVGDGGIAIGRGTDRWGVILENGPGARSRALYAVDATDDGERVYFAGAGGAFGYYDLRTERRRDYSVPQGNAGAFYSLAVAGDRGEEKFLVGDGSGRVIPGHVRDGSETELTVDWETTPNAGNAVEAMAHDADGYGYAVDVSSNVFVTTVDDGWARVGIDDAQGSFYDCAFGDGTFLVGGGNGMVFDAVDLADHDQDATWTPTELGEFTIYGLDAGHGGQLACGEGGNVFVRQTGGDWAKGKHESDQTFRAGLIGEQMVVVGAGGLIVERRAPEDVPDETKARHGDAPAADDESADSTDRSADGSHTSTERTEWVDGDGDESADGSHTSAERTEWVDGDGDESADGSGTSAERTEQVDGVPVESNVEWQVSPESPVEADSDDRSPADSAGSGRDATADSADGDAFDGRGENYDGDEVPPGESGGSGNDTADPADEPDGSGNDEADPPDESDGDGNDESDPADPNTDSDADSPD